MQQDASRKLGFQAKRTMKIAQELYEGMEVEGFGATGLITYMRTDSLRISEEARQEGNAFIEENYGKQYLPEKPRYFKTKASAQDGHEAIRPTVPAITPEIAKRVLLRAVQALQPYLEALYGKSYVKLHTGYGKDRNKGSWRE